MNARDSYGEREAPLLHHIRGALRRIGRDRHRERLSGLIFNTFRPDRSWGCAGEEGRLLQMIKIYAGWEMARNCRSVRPVGSAPDCPL
jgi:hypothetical protein